MFLIPQKLVLYNKYLYLYMNKEHVFAYLEANLSLQHLSDAANKPASEDTCQGAAE